MQLTEHFSSDEMGVTGCEERIRCGAVHLASFILEPIRAHFGAPVRIHCAYRDPAHNARVGGKPNSWHLFPDYKSAADFDIPGVDIRSVFDWLRLQSKLPFDRVILEKNSSGLPVCIHVQFDYNGGTDRYAFEGGTGNCEDYKPVVCV